MKRFSKETAHYDKEWQYGVDPKDAIDPNSKKNKKK